MHQRNFLRAIIRTSLCLALALLVAVLTLPHVSKAASETSPPLSPGDVALLHSLAPQRSLVFPQNIRVDANFLKTPEMFTFDLDNSAKVKEVLNRSDLSPQMRTTVNSLVTRVTLTVNLVPRPASQAATPEIAPHCFLANPNASGTLNGVSSVGIPQWSYTVTQPFSVDGANTVCGLGARDFSTPTFAPGWSLSNESSSTSQCCPASGGVTENNIAIFSLSPINITTIEQAHAKILLDMFGGGFFDVGGGITFS